MLVVGKKAPAISLLDQDGNKVTLASFKGRKVMVFFYPKANTPGCTQQACGLRDLRLGADRGTLGDTVILGISPDASTAQKKFDLKYGFGFPLLADTEHAVAEAYGVWQEKVLYGKRYMGIVRSAFLIDEKGVLSHTWYKVSPKDTPLHLIAALKGAGKAS